MIMRGNQKPATRTFGFQRWRLPQLMASGKPKSENKPQIAASLVLKGLAKAWQARTFGFQRWRSEVAFRPLNRTW
jgi:hypothetical protein